MNLIDEIEISYFRSFYKFKFRDLKDLNVLFGKNDAGKSNVVRALSLFFNGQPDHNQAFDFGTDFCHIRRSETDVSENVRKFLYVKITFNTPASYQRSLGEKFYAKRQWTDSSRQSDNYTFSASIPSNKRHIATRLLNKIRFIYIPAIKDNSIFEMLLSNIYETLVNSADFDAALSAFTDEVQNSTENLFSTLPDEVSPDTKISPPRQMKELFRTLDFETKSSAETFPKSLTRQRGDGVKARHIPELLSFISEKDEHDYHIWGFEEPENSLDFVAAQSEAQRLCALATGKGVQIFISTHSPSFYMLNGGNVEKCYVSKNEVGLSEPIQGTELELYDVDEAIGEGFYLPAVAEALRGVAASEVRVAAAEENSKELQAELKEVTMPIVLTEGRTDELILIEAWKKLNSDVMPFKIRSCETGGANAGSGNGGVGQLSTCLKGISTDHPHTVVGLYDYDEEGLKGYKLTKNFVEVSESGAKYKRAMHGRAYAMTLLVPDFRGDCEKYKNLPIEYLFSDECLETEIDGIKLGLKRNHASTKMGDHLIKHELDDVTHFKEVTTEKLHFAEKIVPTFAAEEFASFGRVFDLIRTIIEADNEHSD